jgi:hypothetical protein
MCKLSESVRNFEKNNNISIANNFVLTNCTFLRLVQSLSRISLISLQYT